MTGRIRDGPVHELVARDFAVDSHQAHGEAADGDVGGVLEDFDFSEDFESHEKRIEAQAKEQEKKEIHLLPPLSRGDDCNTHEARWRRVCAFQTLRLFARQACDLAPGISEIISIGQVLLSSHERKKNRRVSARRDYALPRSDGGCAIMRL